MTKDKLFQMGLTIILFVMMFTGALFFLPQAQAEGEPGPGTVQNVQTYTLYEQTAIVTDSTYYSTGQRFATWNQAEIFVIGDLAASAEMTVTAQVSPDDTNYTDADYEYANSSDAIGTQTFQRVLTADGTEYMRIPMAGEYLRVSIETEGNVTPTIKATMRNN